MKTAIYARTAQENELGIKSQIEFCKDVLDGEDIVVYADSGYSAHDQNRPAFKNMIKDIEDGTVNKVVAYKMDRLCRDLDSLCSFWEFIEAHNASFGFVCESVTSENNGLRGIERFVFAINEMEKMNRSEKCRRGWLTEGRKKRCANGSCNICATIN